jgi:GTP-binding protein
VIIKSVDLIISAASESQFPATAFPEICFAGRSNVGKSSLINALLQRKRIAYTSKKPGKTQTINFYLINHMLTLADLPGYGYAAVAKTKKASWSKLLELYLLKRKQLQLIIHLVDARHEPSELDQQMRRFLLQSKRPFLVVATKKDKVAKSKTTFHKSMLQEALQLPEPPHLVSINEQHTIEKLWDLIRLELNVD